MFVQLTKDFMGQKAGARVDVSDEDAHHLLAQNVAVAVQADVLGEAIQKSLTKTLEAIQGQVEKSVSEAVKQFGDTLSKSRKSAIPAIFGEGQKGDPKRTFGHFLLAVRKNDQKALEEMGSHYQEWTGDSEGKAALNTNTGSQGGYTVPAEFYGALMQVASEGAVVRPRATLIPMGSRSMHVPCLDVTTAPSAGNTAFFGGLVASWTEEGVTTTETEPSFKQVELVAHELSGYAKVSNAVASDSPLGLETLLRTLFGRAIGWYEDYAFLRGNGAGKPLGILNSNAWINDVTRSGASAFTMADAAALVARLLPGWNRKNTVWAVHPTVLAKLIAMSESGTGSDLAVVDMGSDMPNMSLLGIPIAVTEKLPALNTAGDVALLDLRHYLIGDRQRVEIAFSEHYAFTNNQGTWRFVSRVDGQPWLRGKVTLSDATSTLSPFVSLAAG